MAEEKSLKILFSEVLNVPINEVCDELEYRSISQWDSLSHINLIVALENEYQVIIDHNTRLNLSSFKDIRLFLDNRKNKKGLLGNNISSQETSHNSIIHRGLANIYFDKTQISNIDNENSKLYYRGYSIDELVSSSTFEETAYTLIHGNLPTSYELNKFIDEMKDMRIISPSTINLITLLKEQHPIEVLRTVISGMAPSHDKKLSQEELILSAMNYISKIPTIVAFHNAIRLNLSPTYPSKDLSYASNFLYMLRGSVPSDIETSIFDKVLILHADNGSNAASFTARIVSGTEASLPAALTAAIATYSGQIHGGAIEKVIKMLNEIEKPENVDEYLSQLESTKKPVMGFGHRVYQKEDPRVSHLREMAKILSEETNDNKWFNLSTVIEEAMEKKVKKGLVVNVDFYSSIIFKLLQIPEDVFISTFSLGRSVGWVTQYLEQLNNNILIRPLLKYNGSAVRSYTAQKRL